MLQIWDFKSGELIETIPFPSEKGAFLYCARFLSDELIAAGGSGTKDLKLLYRHTYEVISVGRFRKLKTSELYHISGVRTSVLWPLEVKPKMAEIEGAIRV